MKFVVSPFVSMEGKDVKKKFREKYGLLEMV